MQHDRRTVLTLATRAGCDPRTVSAYLTGRDPRGSWLRARLEEAARSLGVERSGAPPVTPTAPSPSEAA